MPKFFSAEVGRRTPLCSKNARNYFRRCAVPVVLGMLIGLVGCASVRGRSSLLAPRQTANRMTGIGDEQEEPQIQPDQPDETNAAYTVPKGLTEIETGAVQSKVATSGEATATPTSWRTGIAHWAELRIETDGVTRDVQKGATSTGFGGLAAGAKLRLWASADGSPAIALQPRITFPWGRAGAGSDYELRIIGGGDITKAFHLDVNYGIASIASAGSHFEQHLVSASAEIQIGDHWQPYGEVFWFSKLEPDGHPNASLDVGATYFVKQRLALAGSVTFDLTASANGPSLFGGLSVIVGEISGHRMGVEARMREAQMRGDR